MEALASTMVTVSMHSAGDCPPKAREPFILPLATSTSFRALRGEHFGIFSLLIFFLPAHIYAASSFQHFIPVSPLHLPVRRGVHCRHPLHPLHAYLCISKQPSSTGAPGWRAYIYAASIYWSTCTWSVSSSSSTGAPCHSRTVAIEIVTAEEF